MKFVCLGYFDEARWEGLPEVDERRMLHECLEYDDELRRGGHFLGGEALGPSSNAVTLSMKNGQVNAADGPFTETKEVLGGILLLEARDLNHAFALMSRHPGIKLGPWEIRAADEEINALIAERDGTSGNRTTGKRLITQSTDALRKALEFSYGWIKPLADDLADAPMTSPTPQPGNHPLWILGHLAYSNAALSAMISGQANPFECWKGLFAGGTKPSQQAQLYPSYAEVLAAYDATHQSVLALLGEMTDSRLSEEPSAVEETLRDDPDFQSNAHVFLFIAMHEMSHRGQLADARRALGRKPFA